MILIGFVVIFGLGAALLGAVVLPIVAFPEVSESAINLAFGLITQELGVIYVALATIILVFLLYAAFGPWGHIRLGNSEVRYSQFSWISMLFCCGIGGSVIYWGASEWVFYYLAPPFSATPESSEA
ncbi:MAG: BCCT family transporter, partial [Candidatus Puniceispirillaceae bacterium]